jgi:hypothetical protein
MTTFTRQRAYIPFIVKFYPGHNDVKARAWGVLYEHKGTGLTLRELTDRGFNYYSTAMLLGRWIRRGYVYASAGKRDRKYYLKRKGVLWLQKWTTYFDGESC